jgi:predicted nucleic acid-binding protein
VSYADTSFIAAAYAVDVNTSEARRYIAEEEPRLPFTFLHWPEVAKALWTNHPAQAETIWEELKDALADGQTLYRAELEADAVAQRAAGLMRHYAQRWPKLRAIDVMHVSAAVECHAKIFLSFDTRSYQRALAHTQKLKVWPALTSEEAAQLK